MYPTNKIKSILSETRVFRISFMGKYHLYITGSETSLKLDQKSLDKKFIR